MFSKGTLWNTFVVDLNLAMKTFLDGHMVSLATYVYLEISAYKNK